MVLTYSSSLMAYRMFLVARYQRHLAIGCGLGECVYLLAEAASELYSAGELSRRDQVNSQGLKPELRINVANLQAVRLVEARLELADTFERQL